MPPMPGMPLLSAGTIETASGATISPRSSDSSLLATKAVPRRSHIASPAREEKAAGGKCGRFVRPFEFG